MRTPLNVSVVASGFNRSARNAAWTPVDFADYINTPPAASPSSAQAAAAGGDFYRKTPSAKAASGGGSRFDNFDVPAFLRRKGGDGPSE
jgi:hypothetical protein